VKRAQPLESGA